MILTVVRLAIPPLVATAGTLLAFGVAIVAPSPLLGLLVLVGAVILAIAAGWILDRRERDGDEAPGWTPVPAAAADAPAAGADATAARRRAPGAIAGVAAPASPQADARYERLVTAHLDLARAVLEVRDLTTSPNAAARLDRALADADILPVRPPTGSPFDYHTQHAAGAVATVDPALDDTVARVLVEGYAIGPHVVRPPQVAVYRTGIEAAGHD